MHNQIQVKPQVNRLLNLLSDIEEGKFKIPTFQRDFVWEEKEKIDLFDSISKEYPIGSILLWRPKEEYKNNNIIGPYTIDNFEQKDFYYILDGYQRLSTLFGCLTNPNKTKLNYDREVLSKKFLMFYDLEDEAFILRRINFDNPTCIPVYVLIDTFEFLDFIDQLRTKITDQEKVNLYIERAKKLSSTIIDYQIPSIEIIGGNISDAVDIFSRINSKGIEISPDWMLSALTTNEDSAFNLADCFSELLEDLKKYNFEDLKREVLVQCIQNSFGKVYFDSKLEDLAKRDDFRKVSLKTIESIKKAVRFLFTELLVLNRKLLPYPGQLIFLTHFFNNVENPNTIQIEKLKNWFWITTYSNYFTIYSLSRIRLAYAQFNKFINNSEIDPTYYHSKDHDFSTADLPNNVSNGSVRSKAFQLFSLKHLNEINPIEIDSIKSYSASFLYKKNKTHGNFYPLIKYTGNSKQTDTLEYVLNLVNYDLEESLFVNDDIRTIYTHKENPSEFLKKRLLKIMNHEKEFVEQLNISYNSEELKSDF